MTHVTANNGRKYALLSEEMLKLYKNLNQNASHTESPEFMKAKKLDREILDILHN